MLFGKAPFGVHHGLPGKAGLVDVDDPATLVPGPGQLSFHRDVLSTLLIWIMVLRPFESTVLQFLDAVHLVDLPQQGGVHAGRGELRLEVLAPVRQRHGGLPSQCGGADDPLDLVWLEESETVILSGNFTLCLSESLADRLVLLLDLSKSLQV